MTVVSFIPSSTVSLFMCTHLPSYLPTHRASIGTESLVFLRVLLVKRPDMMVPTFFAQYQFVCNIKSTYQVNMPGTKNFNVGANTVPWGVILVLGPRQK